MLKERRSRYARVMIILAHGEVNLGGESFLVFGFIDPMNFKKEKKCNLNELMGIELVSLICMAVF
ncbi:MAG: hypothetical protein ACTSSP_09500 [Candidatus Asgardarchaeia archaeon]